MNNNQNIKELHAKKIQSHKGRESYAFSLN